MHGRLCVVTGASSGVGRETARGLAALGARVVLVARDRERGEGARAEIIDSTGNRKVDLLLCDLASSPEVEGETGGYWVKRRRVQPSQAARDMRTAERLWKVSEELTILA